MNEKDASETLQRETFTLSWYLPVTPTNEPKIPFTV